MIWDCNFNNVFNSGAYKMSNSRDNTEDYKNSELIFCNKCNGDRNHEIIYSCIADDSDGYESLYSEYQTMKCLGCDFVHFRILCSGTPFVEERIDELGEHYCHYYKDEELYPKKPTVMSANISFPDREIEAFYNETINALNENLTRLASLGVRSCVERFALSSGCHGSSLLQKIDELRSKEIIVEQEKNQLHGIRFLGNESAHDAETSLTKKQVFDAIIILESIFRRSYQHSRIKIHVKQTV